MAAPVLRAITATPPSGWNLDGHGQPCTSITFSTPETFIAAAPSNDTSLPPVTGGCAITAYLMPGQPGGPTERRGPTVKTHRAPRGTWHLSADAECVGGVLLTAF